MKGKNWGMDIGLSHKTYIKSSESTSKSRRQDFVGPKLVANTISF